MTTIRYWSQTDRSPAGLLGLAYLRALLRISPVRVISVTAVYDGQWEMFERHTQTPLTGPIVNIVCTDPVHWTRRLKISMPKSDGMHSALATGLVPPLAKDTESAEMVQELWTAGMHNVLIALEVPRSDYELQSMRKYDCVIIPRLEMLEPMCDLLEPLAGDGSLSLHPIPIPVTDHALLRALVTPSR